MQIFIKLQGNVLYRTLPTLYSKKSAKGLDCVLYLTKDYNYINKSTICLWKFVRFVR
jgi:hypothetical protein